MQENMVAVIRELMQTQRMSIRKISAKIAKEHGGSALGYTQQINRMLNDPDYDPNLSTIQKILAALNYSIWQFPVGQTGYSPAALQHLDHRIEVLSQEIVAVKSAVVELQQAIAQLTQITTALAHPLSAPQPSIDPCPANHDPC